MARPIMEVPISTWSSASISKILILQLNRLGDLVQTLPLMRRLHRDYPHAEITLVCLDNVQGIVSDCGYFHRLVALGNGAVNGLNTPEAREAFPNVEPFNRFPEFRDRYDWVINLTSDLGSSQLTEAVTGGSKFGRIHSFAGEIRLLGDWSKYLFAMVNNRRDNLFNIVDIHTGMAGLSLSAEEPSLTVSPARRVEASDLLAKLGRHEGRSLIALQSGASQLHRAWALENFADLAARFLQNGDVDIVLLGDNGERERSERLQSLIGIPIIDLVGRTSLQELPSVLAACDLLVSNDTGTLHIAAAVGTRTLSLFFSTAYFSETAPYGAGHAVLQVEILCAPCHASSPCPVQVCRDYLPVDAVWEAALWMLGRQVDPLRLGPEVPALRPNLSLYLSRFLGNGSLIYLPVHSTCSSHFLTALLGRLLWEGALGLAGDSTVDEIWSHARRHPDFETKRRALFESLEELSLTFAQGQNLASKMKFAFAETKPLRERINLLHGQLAELGSTLSCSMKKGGLLGDFLNYEIMDLDFIPYPGLAEMLELKYRRLSEWVDKFQETLTRLALLS